MSKVNFPNERWEEEIFMMMDRDPEITIDEITEHFGSRSGYFPTVPEIRLIMRKHNEPNGHK
jgi:hypothetical protein